MARKSLDLMPDEHDPSWAVPADLGAVGDGFTFCMKHFFNTLTAAGPVFDGMAILPTFPLPSP